jgi:hypothetical protein
MSDGARFVSTRKITLEDALERLKEPTKTVAFEVTFDDDDHAYEDTILLPIACPRIVWKLLYASAVGLGTTVQDVASEWLSDTALELVNNMEFRNP